MGKRDRSELTTITVQHEELLPPSQSTHPSAHDKRTRAVKSARTWNSALLNGRRARGPQWDYATAMYHVPKESQAYYAGVTRIPQAPKSPSSSDGEDDDPVPSTSTAPPPLPAHPHAGQYAQQMQQHLQMRQDGMPPPPPPPAQGSPFAGAAPPQGILPPGGMAGSNAMIPSSLGPSTPFAPGAGSRPPTMGGYTPQMMPQPGPAMSMHPGQYGGPSTQSMSGGPPMGFNPQQTGIPLPNAGGVGIGGGGAGGGPAVNLQGMMQQQMVQQQLQMAMIQRQQQMAAATGGMMPGNQAFMGTMPNPMASGIPPRGMGYPAAGRPMPQQMAGGGQDPPSPMAPRQRTDGRPTRQARERKGLSDFVQFADDSE